MAFDPRAFFARYVTALNEHDFATLEALTHVDFVAESPQSGERTHGFASFEAQVREYPGSDVTVPQAVDTVIIGGEERWALTPGYTVVPLASPNKFTTVLRTQYPDGSWWRVISIVELREEKVYRIEAFFAPDMQAPLAESIGHASPG